MDHAALTEKILDFIEAIGLEAQRRPLPSDTFLPGILIERGALIVDEAQLAYPGDLLHEAGHLAVVPGTVRRQLTDNVRETHPENDSGEAPALAWSYAAALHLGIDPRIVFHDGGYHGRAQALLANFELGVPLGAGPLIAAGMTSPPGPGGFPRMERWLMA